MTTPIRVLIVDDSPFVCRLLTSHLQSSPDIQVVGAAMNGVRALNLVEELRPHVVTLDLEMPEMGGLEALEHIMHDCPTPVVMISGVSRRAADITLRAIELGAVDFTLKYTPGIDTNPEALRQEIIAKVRAAASIKVIRSIRPGRSRSDVRQKIAAEPAAEVVRPSQSRREELAPFLHGGVVVIGASTGGPVAVRELLSQLPADFPAAVIVIQHIPASFTGALAAQLDRRVPLKVKEAQAGDRLRPGTILVAPGDYHLLLQADSRIHLNQGPKIKGHRPSIDVTMQSAAQVYGARTKGVVLTGMGDDGTMGLVAIRAKGGKTFAQDAQSCVINGMPQRAREKGVVDHVASPVKIAELLRYG